MSESNERITVQRQINAPAAAIFAVLTSAQGHVDIDGSGMLVGAPGNTQATAVGDKLVIDMHQDAFGDYTMANRITRFEPGAALEWFPAAAANDEGAGVVYGYELAAVSDSATDVTSYYDWSGAGDQIKASGMLPLVSADMIEATLGKLETVAQSKA